MSSQTVAVIHQLRKGLLTDWQARNRILDDGEPGIATDPDGKIVCIRIGDGVTAWNDLPNATTDAAMLEALVAHLANTAIHTPTGSTHNHLLTITAAEPLGGHRVATVGGLYADSSNPAHAYAVAGITLQAVSTGATVDAQYIGELTESSWNWTPDEPVFLGSAGMLTQAAPDVGFILQIGIPTTSTTLLIDIQQPLIIA